MRKKLELFAVMGFAMAQEYNAAEKLLKFKLKPVLQQTNPTPYNATCENYGSEYWQTGVNVQAGSQLSPGTLLVLNDVSSPTIMTPDNSNTGCATCTGVGAFYDYTSSNSWAAVNATYSMNTDTWNATGVLGVDNVCILGGSTSAYGFCTNSTIFSVQTFAGTGEWSQEGSLNFGRPANVTDPTSSSFLSVATQAGLINQTVWSYSPDASIPVDYTNPGSILVGGYDLGNAMNATINWIPAPVVSNTPDSWIAPFLGMSVSWIENNTTTTIDITNSTVPTSYVFTTGSQDIGLDTAVWNILCNNLATYFSTASSNATLITCPAGGYITANGPCTDSYPWNFTMTTQDSMGMGLDITIYGNTNSLQNEITTQGPTQCQWRIVDAGTTNQVWLGQAFLNQFFTVWDVAGSQVGLAQSAFYSPFPQGPWLTMNSSGGMGTFAVVLIIVGGLALVGVIVCVVASQMRKKDA